MKLWKNASSLKKKIKTRETHLIKKEKKKEDTYFPPPLSHKKPTVCVLSHQLLSSAATRPFVFHLRLESSDSQLFSIKHPLLGNNLPYSVWHCSSIASFKSALKTLFFFFFLKTVWTLNRALYCLPVCVWFLYIYIYMCVCVCVRSCVCVCVWSDEKDIEML